MTRESRLYRLQMPSRSSPLTIALCCVLSVACATNPARSLEPNGVDVKVNDDETPQGLFRGEEPLDEQDFYHLTGDVESETVIKDSRATGFTMQSIGVTLVTVGIAAAAFGLASNFLADGGLLGSPGLFPRPFDSPWIPYVIAAAGGVTAAGGFYLFGDGKEKTLGTKPIFDLAHAQASIENGRYGVGGLKPENIATLELSSARAGWCSLSGASLNPVLAKDKDGKDIKIRNHLEWLTWTAEPGGVLGDAAAALPADAPVDEEGNAVTAETPEPVRFINSPLATSFSFVGKPVKVTVAVKGTGVTTSVTLPHDLACAELVDRSGSEGTSGQYGEDGRSGYGGASGSSGGNGGNGSDGQNAPDVEAEAAWVTDAQGNRLALVAWSTGSATRATLVGPKGRVEIDASGGGGGRGGRGGRGGSGSSGDSGKTPKYCAGNGGNGGSGGTGGRGGNGGRVTLRLADEALGSVLQASVSGGLAGSAGSKGYGGSGGSSSSQCRSGTRGTDGVGGTSGSRGQPGSINKRVVSAAELSMIREVLSANPGFALEASGGSPAPKTKGKK